MPRRALAPALALALAGCTTADNTTAPPGDLRNFDPVAAFPAIAAYAGPDARLVSLAAWYVRTDGAMDLEADYMPRVEAQFVTRATEADVAAQGPRAPGSGFAVGALLQTRVEVHAPRWYHVTSGGSEWDEKHLGMGRAPGGEAPPDLAFAAPPSCPFGQLWKQAQQRGAPADVVAIIRYDATGYAFEANGRDFRLRFSADCAPRD